jgi:hypothetical protein
MPLSSLLRRKCGIEGSKMRKAVIIAAAIGASVGIFWLVAIDAGMNGAHWPPHWRSWAAHVTCPFIPLVGISTLANISVPVLNALLYGLLLWTSLKVGTLIQGSLPVR